MDDLEAFEHAALAQAPPGAVVVGASIAPDGTYGVAMTFLPSARVLMDDTLIRVDDRWENSGATTGVGITWSSLGTEDRGVLRLADEAPEDTSQAIVRYLGLEHRVPVRHGHFAFIAWNAPSPGEFPVVIRFD